MFALLAVAGLAVGQQAPKKWIGGSASVLDGGKDQDGFFIRAIPPPRTGIAYLDAAAEYPPGAPIHAVALELASSDRAAVLFLRHLSVGPVARARTWRGTTAFETLERFCTDVKLKASRLAPDFWVIRWAQEEQDLPPIRVTAYRVDEENLRLSPDAEADWERNVIRKSALLDDPVIVVAFMSLDAPRDEWILQFSRKGPGGGIPGGSMVVKVRIRGTSSDPEIESLWYHASSWESGILDIKEDLDEDGVPDVVLSGSAGLEVLSGADGKRIATFESRLIGVGRAADGAVTVYVETPRPKEGARTSGSRTTEAPLAKVSLTERAGAGSFLPEVKKAYSGVGELAQAELNDRPERIYVLSSALPYVDPARGITIGRPASRGDIDLKKLSGKVDVRVVGGGVGRADQIANGRPDAGGHTLYEFAGGRKAPVGSDDDTRKTPKKGKKVYPQKD